MSKSYKSWALYSIGIFIVWAIIFLIRSRLNSYPTLKELGLVFLGYFLGWLSATIKFILVSKGIYGMTSLKPEK